MGTNTIRAVVIDDEEKGRRNLKDFLKRYCPNVLIIGEADSAKTGTKLISDSDPELVFLDIEMPGGSGFDLLRSMDSQAFEVIFVTAYDQYGIQAIKFCAIDYLLKPINYLELQGSVNKAAQRIKEKQGNSRLLQLIRNIEAPNQEKRLALPTQQSVEFVEINSIVRCQSDNNYTEFHLANGQKYLVCKTLKEYEEILEEYGFFRPHQSHLINIRFLASYVKSDGGALVMKDGAQVPVSRFKKSEVKQLMSSTFLT